MTNLQELNAGADYPLGGQGSKRLLLLLPLAAGALVALLLLLVWVLPQLQRLHRDQQRLQAMEEKVQRLPLLRGQLQNTLQAQERAAAQKRQLLALIAGSGRLDTFMAQVDREAQRHGVALDVLQPLAPPPPPGGRPTGQPAGKPVAGTQPTATGSAGVSPPAAAAAAGGCADLVGPGLQASRQSLVARGRYPNLLAFIRALERLNLLVVQCNLTLEQPAPQASATDAKSPPRLEPMLLRVDLSLFEQGPAAPASRGGSRAPASPGP